MIISKTLDNYKSTFVLLIFFITVGTFYGNKKYEKIQKSHTVLGTTDQLQTLNFDRFALSTFVKNWNSRFNSTRGL